MMTQRCACCVSLSLRRHSSACLPLPAVGLTSSQKIAQNHGRWHTAGWHSVCWYNCHNIVTKYKAHFGCATFCFVNCIEALTQHQYELFVASHVFMAVYSLASKLDACTVTQQVPAAFLGSPSPLSPVTTPRARPILPRTPPWTPPRPRPPQHRIESASTPPKRSPGAAGPSANGSAVRLNKCITSSTTVQVCLPKLECA